MVVRSNVLYPRTDNTVTVSRLDGYGKPFLPEFPQELVPGVDVTVLDEHAYIYQVKCLEVLKDRNKFQAEILTGPTAAPFPEIQDNKLRLPSYHGHAHARNWSKGSIVSIRGEFWKVLKITQPRGSSFISYDLEPSTAEAYAKRPGKVSIPSHLSTRLLGSAFETNNGEWLHIKKVSVTRFGSATGGGHTYWGSGNYVTPERAKVLNGIHHLHIERELQGLVSTRVQGGSMPGDSFPLTLKNHTSLAATGSKVAIVDGKLWYEQAGDPDQSDSWYHYIVEITPSKDLLKRVAKMSLKGNR